VELITSGHDSNNQQPRVEIHVENRLRLFCLGTCGHVSRSTRGIISLVVYIVSAKAFVQIRVKPVDIPLVVVDEIGFDGTDDVPEIRFNRVAGLVVVAGYFDCRFILHPSE
jgi:hypothetical protein